jgi:hypothetical protein
LAAPRGGARDAGDVAHLGDRDPPTLFRQRHQNGHAARQRRDEVGIVLMMLDGGRKLGLHVDDGWHNAAGRTRNVPGRGRCLCGFFHVDPGARFDQAS